MYVWIQGKGQIIDALLLRLCNELNLQVANDNMMMRFCYWVGSMIYTRRRLQPDLQFLLVTVCFKGISSPSQNALDLNIYDKSPHFKSISVRFVERDVRQRLVTVIVAR